jgi:uroporphyrinogen decarboxylase
MTPKERLMAFIMGKPIDRYPVMLIASSLSARVGGMTQRERRSSARNIAKAQIDTYRRFGNDNCAIGYGLHGLGRALGSTMTDPEDSAPAIVQHVLNDLAEIDSLDTNKLSCENDSNLRMQCEALDILIEEIGDEVGISATVTGPFTSASSIYKIDSMLRDMRRNPEGLHKLLRFVTDSTKFIIDTFVAHGAGLSFADPVASGTIIHREQYREFVKPYTTELMEYMHSKGKAISYHICGQTIKIVEDMADCKADILSLDNLVDLKKAKELVGDRVCLVGNVDPVGMITLASPAEIDRAAAACFRNTYDNPKGYMLASGCDIPAEAPFENVDAFMNAARKYGKYPYNPQLFS